MTAQDFTRYTALTTHGELHEVILSENDAVYLAGYRLGALFMIMNERTREILKVGVPAMFEGFSTTFANIIDSNDVKYGTCCDFCYKCY